MVHGHAKTDRRNERLHEAALEKLRLHPELMPAVLALLDRWLTLEELQSSRPWLLQWREMLASWPFERLRDTVLDKERGQTLRQCSPLGPVLAAQERWALLEEIEREFRQEEHSVPT